MTAFTFRDLAFVSGRRLLYPAYVQDYLDRVTAADVSAGNTQGLEVSVTDAISTCLQALVGDGILGVSGNVLSQSASLIKASCLMMGARTLSGALVPLAADMPAPTNFNFVSGDYIRRLGVGSTTNASKYLDINRSNAADPQNSKHVAVFPTSLGGTDQALIGSAFTVGCSGIFRSTSFGTLFRCNRQPAITETAALAANNLIAVSRGSSANVNIRYNNATVNRSGASEVPTAGSIFVFSEPGTAFYSTARIAFYSVGENLDIAILDARITALSSAIQAAIAP